VASFVRAARDGDVEAALSASTGDQAYRAWARAYVGRLRSAADLTKAIAARFGKDYDKADEGQEIRTSLDALRFDDLLSDLRSAKLAPPQADGVSLVTDAGAAPDRLPRVVRGDGGWRVELSSLSEYMDLAETPGLAAEARAVAKLAADVTAGRVADLAAAATATDEALAATPDAADRAKPASGK
jgi:hypothetical protein